MKKVYDINDETFLRHGFAPDVQMTFERKRDFYLMWLNEGMSRATTFRRFFGDKGFDKWELVGIDVLKRLFLNEAVPVRDDDLGVKSEGLSDDDVAACGNILDREIAEERDLHKGERGYLAVLALEDGVDIDEPNAFYKFLKVHSYGAIFRRWMMERGMSWSTVGSRFINEDWKAWERKGVNNILTEWFGERENTELHELNEKSRLTTDCTEKSNANGFSGLNGE